MFGWSALERLHTGIKPHPFSAFTLSPVHLRPEGRGTVRIKSPDRWRRRRSSSISSPATMISRR